MGDGRVLTRFGHPKLIDVALASIPIFGGSKDRKELSVNTYHQFQAVFAPVPNPSPMGIL